MTTHTFLTTSALLALAVAAGCSDAGPPPSSAPITADGRGPYVAGARFGHGAHRRVTEPHAGLATLANLM